MPGLPRRRLIKYRILEFFQPDTAFNRRDNTALICHLCILNIISSNNKLSWTKVAMVSIIL